MLPGYEDIDHKEIMRFYVKECVYDKEVRQVLFYVLKNHDYMNKFYDTLKKYNLYEDYCYVTEGFYQDIINEWMDKNNIKL